MKQNFESLREALDLSERRLSGELSEEVVAETLRQRARQLGQRSTEQEEAVEVLAEVVVVQRGGALFGIPVMAVEEVRSVSVTLLPHATSVVCGLFQIRGRTFSLIDIGAFLATTTAFEHGANCDVILVGGQPGAVGIRIDDVLGHRSITHDDLATEVHGGNLGFVCNVTRDLVQIIDVGTLLSLPAVRITKIARGARELTS